MNREHLKAFLWLRWRLRMNQFRKAGTVNTVLFIIFAVLCLIAAVSLFFVGLAVGLFAFRSAPAWTFIHGPRSPLSSSALRHRAEAEKSAFDK